MSGNACCLCVWQIYFVLFSRLWHLGICLSVISLCVFVPSLTGMHFNKFAAGAPTISEEDFARVLLRHTTWDLDPVFVRLKRKDKPETVSPKNLMFAMSWSCETSQLIASVKWDRV